MSELIEVKVSELREAALDWAVGTAAGHQIKSFSLVRYGVFIPDAKGFVKEIWAPSTDWSQGGPLIEKYHVDLHYPHGLPGRGWWAQAGTHSQETPLAAMDATPLIAACRAIVASVLGPVVSVPKELLP